MTDKQSLMNFKNVRNPVQMENMKRISEDGVCPFCPEYLKKYHTPPILKKGQFWTVTPNMYPYENTSHHFLFIVHEHISDSSELTPAMWSELQELIHWLIHEHAIDSGTFLMRSGDMSKTGGTVQHLHAQFVSGADPEKPVLIRVG